jgi:hypothetical protein
MKNFITNKDTQRNDFVKVLYDNLRKQTKSAIDEHTRFASRAISYIDDGLEPREVIELLILDGAPREAALRYVAMAEDRSSELSDTDGLHEYAFTFEDSYGKIWSSCEIRRTIKASCDEEAMQKAEEFLSDDMEYEIEKIISVERLKE